MNNDILASLPTSIQLCGDSSDFQLIEAEAGDGKPKLKRFSIVGYTGGEMRPNGWGYAVVVDLAGLSIPRQMIPALMEHDRGSIVGHTDAIDKSPQRLKLSGVFSGYSADVADQSPAAKSAREIVRLAGNGFQWQASIGATVDQRRFVDAGETVKVNGRNFDGPIVLIEQSTLAEISFVAIGADMNTSANVAATAATNKGAAMSDFEKWLQSKGVELTKLDDATKAVLTAAHDAEIAPKPKPPNPAPTPDIAASQTFESKMAAIEAENARIEYIREKTAIAAAAHVGDAQKIRSLRELAEHAVADQKIDARAFDLALLRLDRGSGGIVHAPRDQATTGDVVEAAICMTYRLPNAESHFDERTLDAAHKKFRRGIGLKEMLRLAAKVNNGWTGSERDEQSLCTAAFRVDQHNLRASGTSSLAVPGILSNVANKFMAAGFGYGEMSWRKIARIRPANDFKQMTTYRLTGNNKFAKVAPSGEIKHGSLSELTYTNQVETYGRMLGLSRTEIRNDDLGAFTRASDELGRGAIDSLNEVFWAKWLDDSTFFPTDKSLLNYDDGSTDSVLSLAGLDNANTIFSLQTKPDGTPMGVMPKILLVPMALWATAKNLMNGSVTAAAQSTATVTVANIWQGMFDVVPSVYLQSSAITGYSATAWYLLADPNNVAAMEVAFLDGIETPTVETSEFDFDRLGLSMRAYLDWGCNKQEYRAGLKLKGAA